MLGTGATILVAACLSGTPAGGAISIDGLAERQMRKGEEADRRAIDAALKAANESAKDAAPFLHPRLSAVEHIGTPIDDAITEFL